MHLNKIDTGVSVDFHSRYEYDFDFETVARLIPYVINSKKKRGPKASLNYILKFILDLT